MWAYTGGMIAYFDCFSGVSGDMTLGALLACGADDAEFEVEFRRRLAGLHVPGYELKVQRVVRQGISATDVRRGAIGERAGHGRHLSDIAALLEQSTLPEAVRRNALAVFTRLADAEAKIHGTTREEIHFHEVGAVDAIVDITGSCLLLEMLGRGPHRPVVYPLRLRHDYLRSRRHAGPRSGRRWRLLAGFPVHSVDIRGELVTPTGAALLTTLADPQTAGKNAADAGAWQAATGQGKKQFKTEMPNLLRVVIGEPLDTETRRQRTGRQNRRRQSPCWKPT